MIGKFAASIVAFVIAASTVDIAAARTVYDGQWSLTIMTERGNCDSTYHFVVDITNGNVSHPNLVKFRGHVAKAASACPLPPRARPRRVQEG